MPIDFVIPDPINITVTQQSPSHDETDVVLRTELVNVSVPGPQGPAGENAQWIEITQAAYDALETPDPNTLYVVIG